MQKKIMDFEHPTYRGEAGAWDINLTQIIRHSFLLVFPFFKGEIWIAEILFLTSQVNVYTC